MCIVYIFSMLTPLLYVFFYTPFSSICLCLWLLFLSLSLTTFLTWFKFWSFFLVFLPSFGVVCVCGETLEIHTYLLFHVNSNLQWWICLGLNHFLNHSKFISRVLSVLFLSSLLFFDSLMFLFFHLNIKYIEYTRKGKNNHVYELSL